MKSFHVLLAALSVCYAVASAGDEPYADRVKIVVESPLDAPNGAYWMQCRAGVIPAGEVGSPKDRPLIVLTLQEHGNTGTHNYDGIASMWSDDLGQSWHGPQAQDGLDRRQRDRGPLEVPVDGTPAWHAKTQELLLTGATFWIDPKLKRDIAGGPSATFYSVYDPKSHTWSRWGKLQMPDQEKFRFSRAGCTQRVDLPDGDILLPIYFGKHNNGLHATTVVRCKFDGRNLTYVEHGNELSLDSGRGLYEPSLVRIGDKFLLTMRNDAQGYVSVSDDGLRFTDPKPWTFDDGKPLGSYNTQQHWLKRGNTLYLFYTRRGAENDDIFRHRAPVFMAEVDPHKMHVLRKTERVVLPKLQHGFGNFGVCNISANEAWVTAGRRGAIQGEPSVYIARIRWPETSD